MDRREYLLVCLMEECAEIQKEASKILRFGLGDFDPNDKEKKSNIVRLAEEITDLKGILIMLNLENILLEFNTLPTEKIKKVKKYMDYSKEKGILK